MSTIAPEAVTTTRPESVRARRPRIGIFGGYGSGNFGNDASFEALYQFLRTEHPDAEITAICSVPDAVVERFGVPAIPIIKRPTGLLRKLDTLLLRQPSTWANWVRCWKALDQFDVIFSGGTGVFDDFRDTPLGWPSKLLRWCLAARLRGVPWAFVSVGAGPIVSPISRFMMKQAGALAARRLYRDEDSYAFMRRLGVDAPGDGVWPDLAFLLPPPKIERPADAPFTVGVGMMTYRGWRDSEAAYAAYLDLHVKLIEWLASQGHGVRLIIGQAPADLKAAHDVEARLGRKMLSQRDETMTSIHDAMAAIGETDIVIASRYHVQIAALKMGRPIVSLSYGPKSEALMADVGLEGFSQDIDNVDFERLTEQVNTLIAERAQYEAIVRSRVEAMTNKLKAALRELNVLLD